MADGEEEGGVEEGGVEEGRVEEGRVEEGRVEEGRVDNSQCDSIVPKSSRSRSSGRSSGSSGRSGRSSSSRSTACRLCTKGFSSLWVHRGICITCELSERESGRCPVRKGCQSLFCTHGQKCFVCDFWSCDACRLVRGDGEDVLAMVMELRPDMIYLDWDRTMCTTRTGTINTLTIHSLYTHYTLTMHSLYTHYVHHPHRYSHCTLAMLYSHHTVLTLYCTLTITILYSRHTMCTTRTGTIINTLTMHSLYTHYALTMCTTRSGGSPLAGDQSLDPDLRTVVCMHPTKVH
jgi:hypothetical protein